MVWLMPLRACVYVTHGTWLNGSFRAMCLVRVKDMCQVVRVGKWGEASPTLINLVDRQEKKRKKEKKKEKKKYSVRGKKKKKKKERGKENIFSVFRRSELDSPRIKVVPRNKSYAWIPKSKFFVEAPRGRGFLLHWFPFHLRVVNGRMVQPQP